MYPRAQYYWAGERAVKEKNPFHPILILFYDPVYSSALLIKLRLDRGRPCECPIQPAPLVAINGTGVKSTSVDDNHNVDRDDDSYNYECSCINITAGFMMVVGLVDSSRPPSAIDSDVADCRSEVGAESGSRPP